jgi:hypothetical protein
MTRGGRKTAARAVQLPALGMPWQITSGISLYSLGVWSSASGGSCGALSLPIQSRNAGKCA